MVVSHDQLNSVSANDTDAGILGTIGGQDAPTVAYDPKSPEAPISMAQGQKTALPFHKTIFGPNRIRADSALYSRSGGFLRSPAASHSQATEQSDQRCGSGHQASLLRHSRMMGPNMSAKRFCPAASPTRSCRISMPR